MTEAEAGKLPQEVPPIPITVAAPLKESYAIKTVIGGNPDRESFSPNNIVPNSYWFLAINRYTFNAEYNQVQTSNDAAPQGIQPYDSADCMLVVATYALGTDHLPQGPLYEFLIDNGANRQLRQLGAALEHLRGERPRLSRAAAGAHGAAYRCRCADLGRGERPPTLTDSRSLLPGSIVEVQPCADANGVAVHDEGLESPFAHRSDTVASELILGAADYLRIADPASFVDRDVQARHPAGPPMSAWWHPFQSDELEPARQWSGLARAGGGGGCRVGVWRDAASLSSEQQCNQGNRTASHRYLPSRDPRRSTIPPMTKVRASRGLNVAAVRHGGRWEQCDVRCQRRERTR